MKGVNHMDKGTYINELRENLKGLPEEQKEDIIREIAQHIADSIEAGKDESVVIERLGNSKVLANSLAGEYYAKNKRILKAIPFFMSTGMKSFLMVFIFGGMILLFGVGAIGSIVGGVMRTFGNPTVNMTLFNIEAPRILSMPVGLLTAAILMALTYLCGHILIKYFLRVANNCKKRLQLN